MPEEVGPFINNLIRSIQAEAERLPSIVEGLKDIDPTPQQMVDFAGKCVEIAAKAVTDMVQGVRGAAKTFDDPPPDFNVPDDFRDLE